ncbi:MAG: hypothetical protein AAF609_22375 [Cyanobacteria bacterium P01_C01_bin.120]
MDAIARLENLESELSALKALLGVAIDEWVTPTDAAKLVGLSRSTVRKLIDAAEAARAAGQGSQMQYGIHYRQIPDSHHWQVDWKALQSLLNKTLPEDWEVT